MATHLLDARAPMPAATPPITAAAAEHLDDHVLLARHRAGDRTAFGILYERHVPAAHRYARRLAPGLADDIVNEAIASTLAAIGRGHGPKDELRPYLFTAVRRQAARARRSREVVTDTFDSAPTVEPLWELEGADGPLFEAFAELPERWRTVLIAVCVEGAPVQDVAARIGLTPNATSALLLRARTGLRKAWEARRAAADAAERELLGEAS